MRTRRAYTDDGIGLGGALAVAGDIAELGPRHKARQCLMRRRVPEGNRAIPGRWGCVAPWYAA